MTFAKPILAGMLLAVSMGAAALDLQGHRGAAGLLPENSLAGFRKAMELGVTTLELDIVVTKDDVLVIHHDPTLNPDYTRDASGKFLDARSAPIRSMTWAELQTYDVGRHKPGTEYAKRHPDLQSIDGTRIPRLADLFDLVRKSGNDKVRFAIETKLHPERPNEAPAPEAFAQAVVDEVRKAGMAARTQILSFDWRTLKVVEKVAPEIATVYLTHRGHTAPFSAWTAGFRMSDHGSLAAMIKAAGGRIWSANFNALDTQTVKQAQGMGLKVMVWTVNDPELMARVLDWGVDGLITDRPDIARKVLQDKGLKW